MELDGGFEAVMDYVTKNKFELLYITYEHTRQQNQLSFVHKDPFDRMFVSQALVEGIDLISNDDVLDGVLCGAGGEKDLVSEVEVFLEGVHG